MHTKFNSWAWREPEKGRKTMGINGHINHQPEPVHAIGMDAVTLLEKRIIDELKERTSRYSESNVDALLIMADTCQMAVEIVRNASTSVRNELHHPSVDQELVALPKSEYEQLNERSEWLGCLEYAGVDNWSGWEDARDYQRNGE